MKESRLLRFLDRYIGTLLCWIFSLVRRVRPYKAAPQKILLIELFEMGASVMIIPTIRYILSEHPDAEIYILTSKGNRESWNLSEYIDPNRIICLDGKSLFTFGASALKAVSMLRSIGIDLTIDFEKFSRISVILSVLEGVETDRWLFQIRVRGIIQRH